MLKQDESDRICEGESVRRNNDVLFKSCWLISRLLTSALTFLLMVATAATGGELLVNGNFKDVENGRPRGWRIHGDTAAVCGETTGEGRTALRLSVAPGGFVTAASPSVKVVADKQYRVRWRCRTADFEGARAYIFLEAGNRQKSLPDTEVSMRGNGGWTEFETSYRPAAGETEFRVVLATHDEGDSRAGDASVAYKINILNFGGNTESGEVTIAPDEGEKFMKKFTVPPHGHVQIEAAVASSKRHFGFLRFYLLYNKILQISSQIKNRKE